MRPAVSEELSCPHHLGRLVFVNDKTQPVPALQDFARNHSLGGHDVCPVLTFAAGRRAPASRARYRDVKPSENSCWIILFHAFRPRDGWIPVACPPPLALAKAFSRSGCGRIFPLFSGVMRVRLLTGTFPRRPESVLSAPIFSRPVACAVLVNFPQPPE